MKNIKILNKYSNNIYIAMLAVAFIVGFPFFALADDYIYGGDTGDYYYGNDTSNYNYGGDMVDNYYGSDAGDYIYGGDTGDYVYGSDVSSYDYGGDIGNYIYGGDTVDSIYGGDAGDYVYGGDTENYVYGGDTGGYLYGGDTTDIYRTTITSGGYGGGYYGGGYGYGYGGYGGVYSGGYYGSYHPRTVNSGGYYGGNSYYYPTAYVQPTYYSAPIQPTYYAQTTVPNQVLSYTATNPNLASVYLSEVPYTGFEDYSRTIIFISVLLSWSALLAYIFLRRKIKSENKFANAYVVSADEKEIENNFVYPNLMSQANSDNSDINKVEEYARLNKVLLSSDASIKLVKLSRLGKTKANDFIKGVATGEWVAVGESQIG